MKCRVFEFMMAKIILNKYISCVDHCPSMAANFSTSYENLTLAHILSYSYITYSLTFFETLFFKFPSFTTRCLTGMHWGQGLRVGPLNEFYRRNRHYS